MKRTICILVLAAIASGQNLIVPTTLADISGDGSVHAFAATGTMRWFTACALAGNTATIRLGDANITTSRGTPLVAGACLGMNESSSTFRHSMAGWFYLIQSGDKLSITYGQ